MLRPFALSAALAMSLAITPAQAQMTPGAGLPVPAAALAELAQISLSPVQRMELMQILVRARGTQVALRAEQDALLLRAAEELGQPAPDLQQLAAEQETLTDARLASIRQLRDELLAFHDTLQPAQQAEVHAWLLKQIGRIERVRDAFQTLQEFIGHH